MVCLYEEMGFSQVVNIVIEAGWSCVEKKLQCRKLLIDKSVVVLANVTQGINSLATIKSH